MKKAKKGSIKAKYRILLLGAPGSGKGTQSNLIADRYNLTFISPGALLRAEKATDSLLGQYISNNWSIRGLENLTSEIIVNKIIEAEEKSMGFILESLYDLNGIKMIENFLIQAGLPFDYVFELEGDTDTFALRLENRLVHIKSGRIYNLKFKPPKVAGIDDETGEPLEQRSDDSNDPRNRILNWNSRCESILKYYQEKGMTVHKINATKDIDKTFYEFTTILDNPANINNMLEKHKHEKKNLNLVFHQSLTEQPVSTVAQSIPYKVACCVLQELMNIVQHEGHTKFPGTQLATLCENNKNFLEKYPYLVATKIDGVRYILGILDNKCYLVGRKLDVLQLKNIEISPEFNGTLLDGELVRSKNGHMIFVVFDAIQVQKKNIMNQKFSVRLNEAKSVVEYLSKLSEIPKEKKNNISVLDENVKIPENIQFKLQEFKSVNETSSLLQNMSNLPYKTDGLVFIPENDFYKIKFNSHVLKWKSDMENTLDFRVDVEQVEPPKINLQVVSYKENTIEYLVFATSTDPALLEKQNSIIECYWDMNKKEWIYYRDRTDKPQPNTDWVANRFINCILYPLTKENLMKFTKNISFLKNGSHGRYPPRGRGYRSRDGFTQRNWR